MELLFRGLLDHAYYPMNQPAWQFISILSEHHKMYGVWYTRMQLCMNDKIRGRKHGSGNCYYVAEYMLMFRDSVDIN